MKLCAVLVIFSSVMADVWSESTEFPAPPSKQNCIYEYTTVNDIQKYYELKDLPGVQSNNGSIHLELYAYAKRDLHVILSEKKDLKTGDPCIEIVVGASNNSYNRIRNIRKGADIFNQYESNVLNQTLVNPVNVWTNDGEVIVKVNNHQFKGKIESMPFRYVSFASWNNSPLHVYFNCTTAGNFTQDVRSKLMQFLQPHTKHICKLENSTDNLINAYHSLNHLPGVQSNNGSIHLQLYAFAKNDLHILFSEKEDVKPENTDIQIVIDAFSGSRSFIRIGAFQLIHHFPSVLHTTSVNTVNVWINDGEVKVKVNDNYELMYKSEPIAVKYVSFASWAGSTMHVFFNCTTQQPPKILTLPELINESFHP